MTTEAKKAVARVEFEKVFIQDIYGLNTKKLDHYFVSLVVPDAQIDEFMSDMKPEFSDVFTNCADVDLMGDGLTHAYFIYYRRVDISAFIADVRRVNRLKKWQNATPSLTKNAA